MFLPLLLAGRPSDLNPAILPGTDQVNARLFSVGRQLFLRKRTAAEGLGPYFNAEGCISCHHIPVAGGSGDLKDAIVLAALSRNGHFDPLTSLGGPVFQKHAVPGVAPRMVPKVANLHSRRIPPNLLGAGLIQEIPEAAILANARSTPNEDGILGRPNMINRELGRFGYKAQVPSLFQFMFQAEFTEIGITSPFTPSASIKAANLPMESKVTSQEIFNLMYFVEFLAPFKPIDPAADDSAGAKIFARIGCAECHHPSFNTGPKKLATFDHVEVPLYSDLLLHNMGKSLADGFEDGQASGSEFRTAPLWGLGRKKYLLHDGRTTKIPTAINLHGGEATAVVDRFHRLSKSEKEALLEFLKSL